MSAAPRIFSSGSYTRRVTRAVGGNPFPIVGVGASAGGIDALRRLVGALPREPSLALVIIQHLDPHYESQLTTILQGHSSLRVLDATHGIAVRRNHAYVIQPKTNVAITDGVLSVTARPDDRRPHYPIDHFLRSLADVQGSHAVGVILSGTGSDGTLGLSEIKAVGGITFAQDDHSAQHGGMPQSAVESGAVDLVLPPEAIAERLAALPAHPYLTPSDVAAAPPANAEDFHQVIAALRQTSGVDFGQYRDTTIKRRTARRMLLRGFKSPRDYAQFLLRDPGEADALYRDVLINVTSFFREPKMFDELQQTVFPEIVKGKSESDPIRLWVPGCSTGQEAYSLTIVLLEFLAAANLRRDVQVFATDLCDAATLDRARNGVYPENIESEVSPERLRRFFVKSEGKYRIQKSVRDLCVFARQNLTVDPPFSRVDLVSCRNVLIYMSTALQERLLPVFHFALNRGGFLVLGMAETPGPSTDLFEPASREHKIYRRKDNGRRVQLTFLADQWLPADARHDGMPGHPPDLQREADRIVLSRYAPPGVLVDENFDVQQYRGRTAPFLEPPAGQPTANVLRMIREGLFVDLQSALNEARLTQLPVTRDNLHVLDGGRDLAFTLRIIPVTMPPVPDLSLLVLFESHDWPAWSPALARLPDGRAAHDADWFRKELDASKQYLQSMVDAQDAANQELRAAHEEVLSSNEELQSTNEELETTKEELQSANEELSTVNEQFQTRNRELDILTDELSNFISSADVPMVTVGRDLCIRRMTPAAQRAFNMLPSDIGRSIEQIKFALEVGDIAHVIEQVVSSMQPWEQELADRAGRWWVLRVRPYLTSDKRIDGATLMAVDIDAVKRQRDLMEARDYALAVVRTVRQPLVVLDEECRVGLANEAFYRLLGTPAQAEGRFIWETNEEVWSDAAIRRALLAACQGKETLAGLEIERMVPSFGVRTLVLNARSITRPGRPGLLLLSIDDVSDSRQAERLRVDAETLRLVDRRKDEFLGILAHELRNPLAPMRFALDLVRRPEAGPAETKRAWQVLERQVTHMVRIVDDLLDVSRIAHGKVELRREYLQLADIVRSATELSRPAIDAARHTLVVSLPDEPVTIHGDAVRLTQVIVNLLNNAIKFTPPGGHIWLIAEPKGEIAERPDQIRIRVRDTGIGIAPDQQHTVFDMFSQGDRSLERSGGGLGVGLTLVRSLVILHGGSIDVQSEGVGRGTEFIVSLPIDADPEAPRPAAGPVPSPRSRALRILLADDNADALEMLAFLLKREGHTVVTAENGERALEALASFDADAAVLDIGMPGLNGYDVARKLRARQSESPLLLIALSGLGQAEDKSQAIAAGFDQHFTKPIEVGSLLTLLAQRFP
jgi:two-component system, chemotaxis family, CheB/CheR fusion protein